MTNPAVAVHGLTKIFPVPFHPTRRVVAVKDLNLRIEPGEVTDSWAKRLRQEHPLKIILGLVSPTRGRTEIFGRDGRPVRAAKQLVFSLRIHISINISAARKRCVFLDAFAECQVQPEESCKRTARSCWAKQSARPSEWARIPRECCNASD